MDNDPFKNRTDCCCTICTNANRCESALNGIRKEAAIPVLYEGCRPFEVYGRIYIRGMYMRFWTSSLRYTPIGHAIAGNGFEALPDYFTS